MRFFATELLTVSSSSATPTVLSQSVCAPTGAARATLARVAVKNGLIWYNYQAVPDVNNSLYAGSGATFDITDFDNIAQVQFLAGSGSPEIFVSYGN